MILRDYEKLTGEKLKSAKIRQRDRLVTTVRDIFRLFHISAAPRTALIGALKDRERGPKRKQPAESSKPPSHPTEIDRRNLERWRRWQKLQTTRG